MTDASTPRRAPRGAVRRLALLAAGPSVLLAALAGSARAAVPDATVTGPITSPGGAFLSPPSTVDLGAFGWVEEEFFLAGAARGYVSGPLASDGRWVATPADGAEYVTRILVRRPSSRAAFNGTVLVEWLNVSGGLDAAPIWTYSHTTMLREGFAWVGVSAQLVGVSGGGGGPLGLNLSLKAVDPVRYGPLVHPGDTFSYDMFSQVAQAIRRPTGVAPLGPLRPRRVIAMGESQSAFRLVTYVNAVHPTTQVYDGFLIHSRGGGAAPLSQAPQAAITGPFPSFIREDVGVPVLTFATETDVIALGFFAARQPDTQYVRLWEVAGTAHGDTYLLAVGPGDAGRAAAETAYLPPMSSLFGGIITCDAPINSGPQQYVLNAAIVRLNRWVRRGRAQGPSAPRLEIAAGPPPVIARDSHGNALGGIRTHRVDAPIDTLSGLGQSGGGFCSLFGTTTPFDAATLAALYPGRGDYVGAVVRATRAAVRAGFVLKPDARVIQAAAADAEPGS